MEPTTKQKKKRQRRTIEDAQRLAAAKGGKCLSTHMEKVTDRLKWECERGHQWETRYISVTSKPCRPQGSWCPECAHCKPHTIEDARQLAIQRGGTCLSEQYVNTGSPLRWQCAKGHIWEVSFTSVNGGTWCSSCWKRGLEDAQIIAKSRGGLCKSTTFENTKTKLVWECSNGHTWQATFNDVQQGSWCPYCQGSRKERACRIIFEVLTNKAFPKCSSLTWLSSGPTRFLELDGYCEELKLAFEYQGEQHYRKNEFFHKDQKAFNTQKQRDRIKRERCLQKNITLLEIPYDISLVNLPNYIKTLLIDLGYIQKTDINENVEFDFSRIYTTDSLSDEEMLSRIATFYKDYGIVPSRSDWVAFGMSPCVQTYINRFGSWVKARSLAGLPQKF